MSDVDGDGVEDFVVLFSVENVHGSGNNTTQVLAALTSTLAWRAVTIEVGWRGRREVRSILRGPGRSIPLETLSYGPADAVCCPSVKGTAVVEFRDGELRPLKQ